MIAGGFGNKAVHVISEQIARLILHCSMKERAVIADGQDASSMASCLCNDKLGDKTIPAAMVGLAVDGTFGISSHIYRAIGSGCD